MDVQAIRKDFPFLEQKIKGKQIIYFDNAATSQKPRHVLETIQKYYTKYNSAINRSRHQIGDITSAMYRQAHEKVANFIGAGSFREIIFVRNSTEAINLVCYSLMLGSEKSVSLKSGDEIIIPFSEHHSNFVPWQRLKDLAGVSVNFINTGSDGLIDPDILKRHITSKTRLICCTHVSNVFGTINPAKEIGKIAHNAGALFLVDGTQSAPHIPVDVKDIDCDFFAFSGHKMLGPTGIGVLYGKRELLEKMPPFLTGGGMVSDVTADTASWNDLPWKFEAGTPDVAGAIALGGAIDPGSGDVLEGAIDYLAKTGMDRIHEHEKTLLDHALKKMRTIDEIILYSQSGKSGSDRCGIISFNISKNNEIIDPGIIAAFLNDDGIAVRSGGLCAFPIVKSFFSGGVVRASFYLYNTILEIDLFVASLFSIISKKLL